MANDKQYRVTVDGESQIWDAGKYERNKDLLTSSYPNAKVEEVGYISANEEQVIPGEKYRVTIGDEQQEWDSDKLNRNKGHLLRQYPDAKIERLGVTGLQNQPEQDDNVETNFFKGLHQMNKNIWQAGLWHSLGGEIANLFTGSSREEQAALNDIEYLESVGIDPREYLAGVEDAEFQKLYGMNREQFDALDKSERRRLAKDAASRQGELSKDAIKALEKERKQRQSVIDAYQDALAEAGGDLDKAKEILRAKAEDKTWGDEQIEKANAIYAENKELQGAAKWGGLAASAIPSAAALGLSYLTKGKTAGISRWLNKAAKLAGHAGMAGMSAGTAGLSMIEARQHGATNWETWTTGIADGLIEFITEKIPFDKLTKPVLTAAKTRTTKALMDAMRHVDSPGRKELEKLLTEANKKIGGKLLNGKNVADWLANAATEGVSEATAEALQTVTSMIYLNPEEYPTFADVANAAWEGAKGGIALGGVLGGAGKAVEHSLHKDRRKQQGFVNVALVEQEGKNPFVAELVDYDPETKTYKALQDGEIVDVKEDEVQYKHQYTYNEFESGRYRQLEDEAIADGTVSDAQVAVSTDRLGNARQKLEQALTESGYTDEEKNQVYAALESGDIPDFHPQAKALWNAADEYTETLKRDREIQSAKEVKAENERRSVLDVMSQMLGGEFWQKGSRTMQENGMEIIEPDMVEVGTMQDGKQVFILSTPNDNGEVAAITEDGKKMFIRNTDLQDGTTIMPLQEFLDARVSEQKKAAEQARMAEEAVPQLDAIRQKYQMGAQVNLGTEESPTLGQVIGIKPENDGVFIQTETGVVPYTYEQLADIAGTPIRVMTDAQMAAAEAAEIEAAESARMSELAQTPEQMTDAETIGDNAVQMENMATETPLPLNPDGSVNQDALFKESPARWAEWNDERKQDGGASSAQYISGKLAKAQARLAELQAAYEVEDSLNKKELLEKSVIEQQGVVDDLAEVMQKYAPAETAPVQTESVQPVPAATQQERTTESVLASLNDGTLTDEEIRANIDANLAEAQKAYDKYAKKTPKMGTNKDAYLAEKQKYEQGLPALQQEIDFWNGVRQTYESAMQQETMPTEESFRPELAEEDMNPQTPQELAARELGLKEGGIKLLWDSVKAHTGFGNGERQKFFGIFRSKDKGGMTIEAAGERLMEIDREYDLGLLDQSDPMAGVNAILDVLGDVQTIGDLRNYIANNREAQVAREAAAAYSAMNAEFEVTHGMTMEEWAHANEVQRIEIMSKSALTEAEEYERNVKFAEEEYQYGTNEQSTGTEGLSGGENQGDAGNVEGAADGLYRQGDSILQEAQSDNTGGETVSAGQTEENVSESDNQDGDTSVHGSEQTAEVDDLPPADRGVDRSQDDAEHLADPLAMTIETRLKLMAETRETIHERVNTWSNKLGIKINIIDNYRDVQNKKAKANIASANPAEGEGTWGWFEKGSGEVFIYVPDFLRWKTDTALQEVDKTVLHEAIAHKGLSEMLGKERFGELCDKVWQEIMNDEQREKFIKYPGVNGNTRAAADEFIASVSENVKQDTVWDKIANFFKDILNSIGIEIKVADNDLKGLLKQSYRRYRKGEAKTNPSSNQQAEGNTSLRSARGSLVGMHNISEDKLRKVLKQGGLANPSTAVVNIAEYLLDEYGDISLIMPSSLVDASTGDNIGTYTGDAWTPTYPPISRKVDDNGWKVIKDLIRSVVSEDSPLYRDIIIGLENYLGDNRSSKMEFVFLKEKDIEPEIAYKGADGFVGMRNLEAILGVQGLRDGLESYERYKNASPMAKRSFNMWLDAAGNKQAHRELKEQLKKEPKLAEVLKLNEDVSFAEFDSFTYDLFRKEQDAGRIDTYDTMGAAARYVDANNLRGEFEAWLESLMEQAGAKEVFFAGFTRDGDRIYKDNTLENVSRYMRLQGRTNAYDDHGLSATKSALLQRLTSLSQIRKNKARLQNESAYNKEYDALKDRLFSIISQLADMQEISSNRFMNVDYAESRLQEAITKRNPIAHLNKEHGYGIDPAGEFADELNSFIKDVQQMPAKYFETKFERPVYLNEFAAAVMPTTTSEDIKQAVSEAGLPIFEYDSAVEGSRKEATLKATEGEGIRFRTVSDINSQFDAELQQQIEGTLPQGHVYQLGMPSEILKSTGVPDLPIALQSSILNIKANDRWHPFDLNEIKGLVNAIQKPWAIFSYGDAKKAQNLIVGISKGDKQFLVGISLNPTVKGKMLNINSVRNVFPKDNDEWLNWIQEGKLLRVDEKEKIQAIIDALRINPVDYTHLDLDSIAKIVENFENPSTESETRFRTSNNNQAIFVSNAAKAVEGIKQEKATPEQWLKMIEKNGGLKSGEDKWMGLSDWLKASDKKTLTKQEVLDFINENMIVIEETHYAAGAEDDAENTYAMIERILQEKFGKYIAEYYEQNNGEDDNLYGGDSYEYAMDKLREEMNDEFPYTIERSNSVVYLTFPYEETVDLQEWADKLGIKFAPQNPINYTRLDYTTDGLNNKHEIALIVPSIESWNEGDEVHFGDAGDGRAIAWIRFGEAWEQRPSPQISRKVLVIDEIQSKRHQAGREKGYTNKKAFEKAMAELEEVGADRLRRRSALIKTLYEKYGQSLFDFMKSEGTEYNRRMVPNEEVMTPDEVQEYYATSQDDIYQEEARLKEQYLEGVPDAPFDKNWHELAMKRMLRYAAENGYDVIAWTKGEQQAERYNIGKVIDSIYYGNLNGNKIVRLTLYGADNQVAEVDSEGRVVAVHSGNMIQEGMSLAEIVGKEIALKIMNNEGEKVGEDDYKLSGEGLRVGGEGMKGFYDRMLPAFMNKYGKKWGVKVEDINFPGLEGGLTMHSVPVTEEMKESVMEGQVMFRTTPISPDVQQEMDVISATAIVNGNYMKAPNGKDSNLTPEQWAMVRTKSFKQWFGDWENDPENASKVIDENGEPMVVYHGSDWNPTDEQPGDAVFMKDRRGIWFTGDIKRAQKFADVRTEDGSGVVSAVFLNIRKPSDREYPEGNNDDWRLYYELGYDGWLSWDGEKLFTAVVHSSSQIKSATDNTGEFSAENNDIRFRTKYYANTNPTEAQKKAGNYKMGHIRLDGYNITIENPKGSVRRGTDSKGNAWENTLNNDYGYIRGTEGVDGDHIDVYLSDNPTEGNVFVIDQVNPETREFDEHKVMYGFNSAEEAREAYLANFSEGWNGLGTITEVSKDEFKKWIESSHRKTKPFSEYKSVRANEMQATDESDLRYRVVTNQETLDRLNSEPTIKVYRAMQVIDGKLYPPMSAKVDGKLREPIELGQWEEAEERPDLADEKGNFKLDKGNKSSVPARYNPYFHTSRTPLNDQFSSAQTRPNLVTVEVEVPESELTSGYKAEKAKDSVGEKEWKAGIIQGKLSGTRKVILSRWDKPVRIVPDSEVAERIVEMFDGRDITMPSNVVTPSLRTELEKLGVPFIETNNQGKPIESTQFRTTGTPTEQVVSDGVVLSNEDLTNLAGNIFSAMPEDVRRKVVENAARDNYDLKKATLQMSASLAEKAELTDEEIELAKMVAQKVEDAVLASGVEMTRPFTTNEALWVFYRSINPTSEYDLIGSARKAVVADNLGFSKSQQEEQKKDADNIRFRSARGAAANSAAAMYNNEQRSAWGMLRETYQDMYRSVKSLMQSIEKATGKAAQSWENILTSLNALSSKNLADKKKYLRDFLTPMWDSALAIRDKYHKSLEQIERYLMIKHGLERNKVLAARDARNFYREQADREIAAIKADKSLSKAEQKARIQRVEDTYDNHVSDIEAGIDAKFQEFRAKDYGGLTALFSDFADYGTREDYESEELYQEAALAARTPKYATLAETELAAQQEVDAFETEVDKALIDNLWKKINAATKETLRHQYANNLLTKEQYERVRDMFEFYVPLRGFVDTTAEDTYSYYVSGQQSKFANPLQGAKGRKTQAETPLGWIGSMAESAIQMDNKNTAKLALYYFAVNRPNNDILKITPTWYEWTGEVDSDGKKIFEPVYPTFNGPQSGPAMQAQMDAFESMMEQQAQAGNAYKGKQRIDLKEAVIRAPKSAPEHVVTVKVAGEDYSIIINANPRAAQAINGMLNVETRKDWFHRATTGLLRYMAAISTSYSPLFWITNFMRDVSFAFINTSIRNDAGYTKEFAKNYPQAFRVFSYVHKNRKAALGDSKYEKYYTEFAENGGITGYTSLTNNTEYDQIMRAYANDARAGKFIRGMKSAFEVFQNVGESFEQVSRFAAYITARESGKDISESIYEAKEVTINFNRKGSGRALTMEEAEKFRRKNGKKLTVPERIFFVTLAGMSPFAREFYMFFNAGMQGVRMIAKLVKEHPGKFAAWHGIVFTMGLINAIMHSMMEDDDEYLDMPDYVRRTNILIGKNGTYFKWSLPHEFRPSYAMADIFVQHAMGRKPNKNIAAELAEAFGEWLPINPFKDGMNAFVPDFVKIVAEIKDNKDFTGSPIYREYRWLTEEQQKNMPAYEKGFDSTSKILVDVSEMLNDLSGGDQTKAGFININPAVVEHLAQKFGGGPLKLAEQFFKTIGVITGDQEFSIRNTPFLSTFMVAADDRYRNAHTTELFKYYKGMADDVKRRAGEYKAEKDKVGFDKLRASDDFQIFQIYRKYEKRDKFYNEQLKRAKSDSERKEIMSLQDAHRKRMIEEISNL